MNNINSKEYWDYRFDKDWVIMQGEEQTDFFTRVALELMPAWFKKEVAERGLTVCDFGCAMGQAVNRLAQELNTSVFGADFSDNAIREAGSRYPQHTFFRADITDEKVCDRTFDVGYISNVLEHLEQPWDVAENVLSCINTYFVILIPFRETMFVEEHCNIFDIDRIPVKLGGFRLVHVEYKDCSLTEGTLYADNQILLIYEREDLKTRQIMLNEYVDTFERKQLEEISSLNADIIGLKKTAADLEENLVKEREEKAVLESEAMDGKQLIATLTEKVQSAEQRINSLDRQLEEERKKMFLCEQQLHTANQNIEETQAYNAKLEAENEEAMAHNAELLEKLDYARRQEEWYRAVVYDLQTENEMYRTSFSWRLTLPLRFVRRCVLAVLRGQKNLVKKTIIKLRNSKAYPVLKKCIPRAFKKKLEAKYFHDAEAELLLYNTTQENEILKLVEDFEKTVDTKDKLLLVFSGVRYVDHEGQRGIRLIHEARQLGVRVVFAYWRWSKDEQIDESEEDLIKIPIDILASQQVYFFEKFFRNIPDKTLLVEFPHPLVTQIIEIANSFAWKTVYDVIDDWEEFSKCGQAQWYRKEVERKVSNIVDINVATAYVLRDKIKKDIVEDKPYYVITNGVDPNRMKKSEKIAEYDCSKGSMQIGYFGHLTDAWFDWDMLRNIARRRPEWTFHLIGYGAPDNIDLPDNIILYGKKAPEELPKYAAYWDVAIIPFINNELTRGVNPIKVFEYLQLRLPVVASDMPEIAGYPYVTIAVGEDNFEKAVAECASIEMDDEQVQRFIEKNTWKNKCLGLLNSIADIEKTY